MNDYLEHYGVKGMKWGVRKNRVKTANPIDRRRAGGKLSVAARPRPWAPRARSLSDKELKSRVNRLEMEKKYRDLTRVDYQPALSFIGEMLKSFGSAAAGAAGEQVVNTYFGGQTSQGPNPALSVKQIFELTR